ncbi:MAG: hypothetical protein ACRELY_32025 [Polyangiaceae bacterium]
MSPTESTPEFAPLPAGLPAGSASRSETGDEVDPELVALPDPPKSERSWTIVVLLVTVLASTAMMVSLVRDALYAVTPSNPADLGELHGAQINAALDNHYVRGEAMLGAAGAIRYERAFDSDSYRVAPVAGRPDLWVEIRVPDGQESSRFVPPTQFSGRLVRFAEVGPRHRGLQDAIAGIGGGQVPENAWLLVDGEPPVAARWAVSLVAMFFGFAMWNAVAIQRLLRRIA